MPSSRIIDLERDDRSGMTVYEIKLPVLWEEDGETGDVTSQQINTMMPHVSLTLLNISSKNVLHFYWVDVTNTPF